MAATREVYSKTRCMPVILLLAGSESALLPSWRVQAMEHHGVGVAVQAAGQRCVLLTTAEPGGPGPAAAPAAGPQTPGQLSLILCDALGSPCGSVQLAGGAGLPAGPGPGDQPGLLAACATHAAMAAAGAVFLWHFGAADDPGAVQAAGGAAWGEDAGGGAGEADAHAATGCWVLDMGACAGKQARFSAI